MFKAEHLLKLQDPNHANKPIPKLHTVGQNTARAATSVCVCVKLCSKERPTLIINSRGPLYPSPGSGQRRAWCWVLQTYLLRDAPGHSGCSWWSHLQTLQVLFQPFFEAVTRYFAGCSWTVPKILVADPSLYLCRAWLKLSYHQRHIEASFYHTSVSSLVEFRKPLCGTAPSVIPIQRGNIATSGRCAFLALFLFFLSSCFSLLLPGADMY